jgi:3'-phosphoadenosine 5'-phosphosulfate sulfotransferase (PAPS reductase)/FAD synthetase
VYKLRGITVEYDMIVVGFSGGKDSTATLFKAIEDHPNEKIVPLFNDTGWEHPLTYEYIDYISKTLGIEVQKTKSLSIPDLIRKTKYFPNGKARFCTRNLKQDASYYWFRDQGYYKKGNALLHLGIRSSESVSRKAKYGALSPDDLYEYKDLYMSCPKSLSKHVKVKLPILDWSVEDVWNYLDSKGIKRNPLYDEGTNDRVGCYPCLLSGRKTQERVFLTPIGQERLNVIRQLEKEIGTKYTVYDTDQGSCEICKT